MSDNQLVITLQMILNIVLINGMAILALLGIHEMGHVIFGVQMGCSSGKAILLDTTKEGPYAELTCPSSANYVLAYAGSLITSIAFGSLFLLMRNSADRNIFFIILGFSLIFGVLDIIAITGMGYLFYVIIISGFSVVVLGELLLTSGYVNRELIDNSY